MINRAIQFDDPITAGNVLAAQAKKLLKEDLERNYLIAIYNNRVENFKSFFLVDKIFGRIEGSENELKTGNSHYTFIHEMDIRRKKMIISLALSRALIQEWPHYTSFFTFCRVPIPFFLQISSPIISFT